MVEGRPVAAEGGVEAAAGSSVLVGLGCRELLREGLSAQLLREGGVTQVDSMHRHGACLVVDP